MRGTALRMEVNGGYVEFVIKVSNLDTYMNAALKEGTAKATGQKAIDAGYKVGQKVKATVKVEYKK